MYQLIEKMSDDMQLRGYSAKTISAYTSHTRRFEEHFEKHHTHMGKKQIRQYLFMLSLKVLAALMQMAAIVL